MKNDNGNRAVCSLLITALFVAMAGGTLHGQSSTKQTGTDVDLFEDIDRSTVPSVQSLVQPRGIALESTIDPRNYYVGPSDVFSVSIWATPPLSFILTVTPEGTLIIPTVGEVHVSDSTLAAAKMKVVAEVQKKYKRGLPTVTLVTPRPIVVTVTGYVMNPGSFTLASYYRAGKAIEQANVLLRTQEPWELKYLLTQMSTRNVRVSHRDGTASRADITKFLATQDDRWNPYLREGDVIVVPRTDFTKSVIGVYGAVNNPGRFEFVEGDSIKDALQIAYGFTSEAIADSILLTRLSKDGATMSSEILDGNGILAGRQRDVALRPGDRIVVRARQDFRSDYRVKVSGEVVYPGFYPITRNQTHLSEVIRAAGGLTESASLRSAELIRQSVQPNEIELERLESLRGGVSPEDSSYYYLETTLRIRKEMVNVDMEKLFVDHDTTQDVIVQNDDQINVPSIRKTIYVFGQVVSTGHIPFVEGRTVDYYIRKAGGLTERARSGDIKIVKAKTRQWLSPKETTIEEGDYVWVPKDPERPFSYYMNIIGQTSAIVSVAVSVVLLVIQSKK